jgi:hypothetical protein
MNDAPTNAPALELSGPTPPGEGWSRRRWWLLVLLVFMAHLILIFAFGTRKQTAPRAVTNVPQLQLADAADDMVALTDPTLFALPNPRDFASAIWLPPPVVKPPAFRFTETPRWLPLAGENLGAVFTQLMQTNLFAAQTNNFKPAPVFSEPELAGETALPQNSTFQITGDLAQRRLLDEVSLPSLPYNDVLAPSKVQALVDADGNVISAVLLPSENPLEALGRADLGDTNALAFTRRLRFAPAPGLTFGELIFRWHTLPPTATNAP